MDAVLQDLRYAFRTLGRAPAFAAVAVLTLGLGIGANAAVFSLVNALVLRPPAHVQEPDRLVALYTSDFSGPQFGASSWADLRDFADADVFGSVAAYAPRPVELGEGEAPERVGMELVSDGYFTTLGVPPARGRLFGGGEAEGSAAAGGVVIGHELWRRRFGGADDVVGRTLRVNGVPLTVLGVAPAGFHGSVRGMVIDVWARLDAPQPVGMGDNLQRRGSRGLLAWARLAPGATPAQAQARMDGAARQLHAEHPGDWTDVNDAGRRVTVLPEAQARIPPLVAGTATGFVALLAGTVGLVLLVCCANVAGLVLARATARAREVGVRLSLGASRGRLVRQMMAESVVLSVLGAAVGMLAATWAADSAHLLRIPFPVRLGLDLSPDARVLAFTAALTLATAVLFGMPPALRATRLDPARALHGEPSLDAAGRRLTLRNALVVGQVALSLLLVVGAFLFVGALRDAAAIDPGFRAEGVLVASVEPRPGQGTEEQRPRVDAALRERLATLPGVEDATWAAFAPLGMGSARRGMAVEGYAPRSGEDMEFHFNAVGPRYFETLQIPVVRGRALTADDREGAPPVAVVSEAFAQRFWPGGDALGQRLSFSGPEGPWVEVVGVARGARYLSLTEEAPPYVWLPAAQAPWPGSVLHVRTSGDPRLLLPSVRQALAEAAPQWMLRDPATLRERVRDSLLPQRVAAGALGVFGMLAVGLAAVGLYGVVAYAVARRTREIGVRVALGARRLDVQRLVVRQGAALAAAGVLLGMPAAWALSRVAAGLLLGRGGADPLMLAGAGALLVGVAALASWLPARRAARIEPMAALRVD